MTFFPTAREEQMGRESFHALFKLMARTLSMWSIAGMTVRRLGVPQEKIVSHLCKSGQRVRYCGRNDKEMTYPPYISKTCSNFPLPWYQAVFTKIQLSHSSHWVDCSAICECHNCRASYREGDWGKPAWCTKLGGVLLWSSESQHQLVQLSEALEYG